MIKSNTIFAAAAAALCTSAIMLSPVAYAAEAAPQARVSWQGLDLTTDVGQRTLAHRTETAANLVCPDMQVTGSHLQSPDVRACRAAVRAQIAQRVATSGRMALRN